MQLLGNLHTYVLHLRHYVACFASFLVYRIDLLRRDFFCQKTA